MSIKDKRKEVKIIKRKGNIYTDIYQLDNIKQAITIASRGKRNRREVKKVYNNIDYYAKYIRDLLINKKYVPSEYKIKTIQDGVSKKERVIYKPKFFPDQ